jgi:hypothetical protein
MIGLVAEPAVAGPPATDSPWRATGSAGSGEDGPGREKGLNEEVINIGIWSSRDDAGGVRSLIEAYPRRSGMSMAELAEIHHVLVCIAQ